MTGFLEKIKIKRLEKNTIIIEKLRASGDFILLKKLLVIKE